MSKSLDTCEQNSQTGGSDLEHADAQQLFDYFHPRLVRFTNRYLNGTGVDPDDVAQEAIWKAISRRELYNPKYRFSTWVYIIARRTAYDHVRNSRRHESSGNLDEIGGQTQPTTERVDDRDDAERLWKIAQSVLSSDQHSALWLRYGEDMSISEVAAVMKKSAVSTRVLLFRARSCLRSHLDAERQSPSAHREAL